jgi:hypothetical protein
MDESREAEDSDAAMRGFSLGVGLAALSFAVVAALFAVGAVGPPGDVILVLNGHRAGGPGDRMLAGIIALVFGALGVFCVLRFRRTNS